MSVLLVLLGDPGGPNMLADPRSPLSDRFEIPSGPQASISAPATLPGKSLYKARETQRWVLADEQASGAPSSEPLL